MIKGLSMRQVLSARLSCGLGRWFPVVVVAVTLVAGQRATADWPQYSGPAGDRTVDGPLPAKKLAADGSDMLWRAPTTNGFSSFAISDGIACTLMTRDGKETCVAFDAVSGQEQWARPLSAAKYDGGGNSGARGNRGGDGPRSTPTFSDGRVYVFDSQLKLYCFDAKTGEAHWTYDVITRNNGKNITWQNAASPVIHDELVFIAGGGKGEALIAVHKKTGRQAWATQDDTITHATPTLATIHGTKQVIYFTRSGLVSVEPRTGKVLWREKYDFRVSTAASPVVYEDIVYVSAGYGVGAGAFRVSKAGNAWKTQLLWRKKNDLMNHWSTPLVVDGYLYGMFSFKKYGDGPMMCVDIRTGEEQWETRGFGPGNCILVGGTLVALSDSGEVVFVEATPKQYKELFRKDVLEGKCWTTPTYADGRLYVRSTEEGKCFDLGGEQRARAE